MVKKTSRDSNERTDNLEIRLIADDYFKYENVLSRRQA